MWKPQKPGIILNTRQKRDGFLLIYNINERNDLMTDMPVFGILCCGKDIAELSKSVKACSYITSVMKDSGFDLGGYHTQLLAKSNEKLTKMCENKLLHICRTCDVVFTVGCDGFAADDVMPEITTKVCDGEAAFFTSHLCGLSNISNYDAAGTKKKKSVFPPSRSIAGVKDAVLVMNIRNDLAFIRSLLPALLPSVAFAAACLSGKDAQDCKKINETLERLCNAKSKVGGKMFFENIQKLDTKNS